MSLSQYLIKKKNLYIKHLKKKKRRQNCSPQIANGCWKHSPASETCERGARLKCRLNPEDSPRTETTSKMSYCESPVTRGATVHQNYMALNDQHSLQSLTRGPTTTTLLPHFKYAHMQENLQTENIAF